MSAAGSTVVARVLRLANEVHVLARTAGRDDIRVPLAEQAARWGESCATVVVAGAQKRGKSRLLNALVGHPDLLPVDADIATHTQVALSHGPELRVVAHRTGADGPTEREIDPAQLAAHASVLGDPAVLREVTGLDVILPEPLLEGIRLVDTPGVDGLTLGHRHATMAALARADAVLFAVSAQDQPILRHELEFLAEAAARVHAVAFVLTKVEDATSWRALLAENQDRLRRFCAGPGPGPDAGVGVDTDVARRLLEAPWLPVSAKLAEAAAALEAAGNPDRARARLARSGLPALRALVRRHAQRRELVRAGGILTLVVAGLRALAEAEQDRTAGADADAGATLDLRRGSVEAGLAELAALRSERRRRSIDHPLISRRVAARGRTRLEGYRRTYEAEIADLRTAAAVDRYAEELPTSLGRTLTAAWEEIGADTERAVAQALPRYLREMGVDPSGLAPVAFHPPGSDADLRPQDGGGRFDLVGEGLPAAMMAGSVGFMAHNAAVMASLAVGFTVLAPIALGGLLAGTFLAHKRRVVAAARSRSALTKALGDAFAAAAAEAALAVEQAVAVWRADAEAAVDAALAARQQELDARRKELAALSAQDGAQRKRTAADAARRLETLEDCRRRATELGAELEAALRAAYTAQADPPR